MKYLSVLFFSILAFTAFAQSGLSTTITKSFEEGGKVYGAYCGIAGQHPPSRLIVERLITERDLQQLSSWLNSPNLVIQTYAAEAFIRLSNEAIEFSEDDRLLVEKIKNKEDRIPTCQGCVYEKLTIKECLSMIEATTADAERDN